MITITGHLWNICLVKKSSQGWKVQAAKSKTKNAFIGFSKSPASHPFVIFGYARKTLRGEVLYFFLAFYYESSPHLQIDFWSTFLNSLVFWNDTIRYTFIRKELKVNKGSIIKHPSYGTFNFDLVSNTVVSKPKYVQYYNTTNKLISTLLDISSSKTIRSLNLGIWDQFEQN